VLLVARHRRPRAELYIDLGTANTLLRARGGGLVLDEPSVVALREDAAGRRAIVAAGGRAHAMVGRIPQAVTTVRPLREGVIADFGATTLMLREFAGRYPARSWRRRPHVAISLPYAVTAVEREAVREAGLQSGAGTVTLLDEPMAAAIGAGLPALEASASMIVDVGSGITEAALISLGGIVLCESVRLGGDHMDEAIAQLVRRRYNVLVGERSTELAKIVLARATGEGPVDTLCVRGRDLTSGLPCTVRVTSGDVLEAVGGIVDRIVETVRRALAGAPAELAADVAETGITLTGGGAFIRGLDTRLARVTGVPVSVDAAPLSTIARGGQAVLDHDGLLERIGRA